MRNTFASEITTLASIDERVVLLSGDIGNRMFDEFKEQFPDRFYNCGVAEQNMMGVAAGLALSGLRPYVYTIAPFLVYRPFEQIRTDICYHDLPVVIAAVGAGLAYAELGPSHHSCEDIAALRAMPNLNIVCPGDSAELAATMRASLIERHPTYLRMGKKGEPVVHNDVPEDFRLGKVLVLEPGSQAVMISTGNMLPNVVEAARDLRVSGIDVEVVSMHTVKPLDVDYLEEASVRFPLIVTVEEHSLIGGLGSAVAEWIVDRGHSGPRVVRLGTPDAFFKTSMNQAAARESVGLAVSDLVASVRAALSTA